jgi:hypothetical protein
MKYALLIPASVITILFALAIWTACTAFKSSGNTFQPAPIDSIPEISHQTLLGHAPLVHP